MTDLPKSTAEHLQEQMASMRGLLALAAPFSSRARNLKCELNDIREQMEALMSVRRAFEKRFAPLGWSMFDRMSSEVLQQIADLEPDEGEAILVEYHLEPDTLRFNGQRLKRSRYRPWLDIYDRAVERASAGDCLSAVPLTLIVIDGLVNQNTGKHAFSGGIDAPVFDTAASGPGGVANALRIMGQQRGGTNEVPLAMPYRHGILHGKDVNFGHAQVAAKSFNALHAVIDYCDRKHDEVQRLNRAKEEQAVPSWRETIGLLQKVNEEKEALRAWQPRPQRTLEGNEGRKGSANFEKGTPEAAAVQYLNALTDRPNYGHLASATLGRRDDSIGVRAKHFRDLLSGVVVLDWRIVSIEDKAAAACEVVVKTCGEQDGRSWSYIGTITLIHESEDGDSAIFGYEAGTWKAVEFFLSKVAATALFGRHVDDTG